MAHASVGVNENTFFYRCPCHYEFPSYAACLRRARTGLVGTAHLSGLKEVRIGMKSLCSSAALITSNRVGSCFDKASANGPSLISMIDSKKRSLEDSVSKQYERCLSTWGSTTASWKPARQSGTPTLARLPQLTKSLASRYWVTSPNVESP